VGDLLGFKLGPRRGLRRGISAGEWYERGCALESVNAMQAIAAYRRALAGRPDFPDAHNNLGRNLHDQGDLAAAEGHYRLALCGDRSVALYWFNLGVVVEDQGRAAEAIALYEQALALDAGLADAHFNLARLYDLVGRRANNELVMRRAFRHLVQYRRLAG
jgi:tetratricopeptide (TPR) repeat protein